MTSQPGELSADLLMTLEALLRHRNVTHASIDLGITQPAMSARLAKLRRIFDDQLFVPAASGRGMVATPRALALQPAIAGVIDQLRGLVGTEVFDPATSTHSFSIALHDNPAAMLAPDLVQQVQAIAPNVRLAFVMPVRTEIATQLENGVVDLLIGSPEVTGPDFIGRTLFDEDFLTAQRKGHPRGTGPLDLDAYCAVEHLLISADGGSFAGVVDEALARQGRARRVTVSLQSYAVAPLILATSDCVCTLPRRFLERFAASLDFFEPPIVLERFKLTALWHPRMQNDPAHSWLREQIFAAARMASLDQSK